MTILVSTLGLGTATFAPILTPRTRFEGYFDTFNLVC